MFLYLYLFSLCRYQVVVMAQLKSGSAVIRYLFISGFADEKCILKLYELKCKSRKNSATYVRISLRIKLS